MTSSGAAPTVWDASSLLHASRCDRFDVLLAQVDALFPGGQHVTSAAVAQEVARRGGVLSQRLDVVHVDGLAELSALVKWLEVLGSGEHNRGEATVCAWAEVHGGRLMMDDQRAVGVARQKGLEVRRTLWVCGQAVKSGADTLVAVSSMVDAMIADGARFPFQAGGFAAWHAENP